MRALRSSSSRAEITPTRFTNFYTFGDFKGNPANMLTIAGTTLPCKIDTAISSSTLKSDCGLRLPGGDGRPSAIFYSYTISFAEAADVNASCSVRAMISS